MLFRSVGVDNLNGSFFTNKYTGPEVLGKAVWASANTDHGDGSQSRTMYGELGLPGNLTPSFVFGEFEVKVGGVIGQHSISFIQNA